MSEQTGLQTSLDGIVLAKLTLPSFKMASGASNTVRPGVSVNSIGGIPVHVISPTEMQTASKYMEQIQSLCLSMGWTLKRVDCRIEVSFNNAYPVNDAGLPIIGVAFEDVSLTDMHHKMIYDYLYGIANELTKPDGVSTSNGVSITPIKVSFH